MRTETSAEEFVDRGDDRARQRAAARIEHAAGQFLLNFCFQRDGEHVGLARERLAHPVGHAGKARAVVVAQINLKHHAPTTLR